MRAVIMAGGRGSRLAPYTTVLPKPLMPLSDRPVIDILLRQFEAAGVEHVDLIVGHLGGLIEAWVRHAGSYRVPISFVYEGEPLGTAGGLKLLDGLDGTFIATNGDILTSLDFRGLAASHRRDGTVATMAVKKRTVAVEYGVVDVGADGLVRALDEKPTLSYTVSMGIYAFDASITDLVDDGEHIDFPDLLMRAIAAGRRVGSYPFDGYWRDIGNRDDYEAAITDFAEDPQRFLGAARHAGVAYPG